MVELEELKKLTLRELEEEVQKSHFDLLKLKLAVASRQSKETAKLKSLRKYIARIKTMKQIMAREKAPETAKSSVTK